MQLKYLDGSLVDMEYERQISAFVAEVTAFEEQLTPDELDEMEREIENKKEMR